MEKFDAIVVGAGHAGCEAGLALARTGQKTLLLTISLDSIAFLACNPSIGGTSKGQLVSEIDALGGEMGLNADKTLLQKRMLNRGKGPAVQSLRAQQDKQMYHFEMKRTLEGTQNLVIKQAEVVEIEVSGDEKVIKTAVGETFRCKAVVFATGVYLKSNIIIGNYVKNSGPNGFANSEKLSQSLSNLGITMFRFKTGTPARVSGRSINFEKMEVQKGEDDALNFSYLTKNSKNNAADCYLTYTNPKTHQVINDHIEESPMYSGLITGVGPRYCPSIETKIIRFKDKERHQVFLEPESGMDNEWYVQGMSTSMPVYVQKEMYSAISGLENLEIVRDAYAIEYDCIDSLELKPSLEHKSLKGMFFAGQINGTSGYEEAAAQGIMAGINASLFLRGKEPVVLKRSDAYIGVLIDDLVTKGTNEPYRMMTSRAEYRLLLRQDNADIRLSQIGRDAGLVTDERYNNLKEKLQQIENAKEISKTKLKNDQTLKDFFAENNENLREGPMEVKDVVKRNNMSVEKVNDKFNLFNEFTKPLRDYLNTEIKYEGYLKQQEEDVEKLKKEESILIPETFDYSNLANIRIEALDKLKKIKPISIGQASRISGVSPSDVAVLTVLVRQFKEQNKNDKSAIKKI